MKTKSAPAKRKSMPVKKTSSSRRSEPLSAPAHPAPVPPGTAPSPTAVAAEALRTGVVPLVAGGPRTEIPREDETIRVGDPDDRALDNEYVGDQTPGGSSPTPDQSNVDDIGRAYGLQEEDDGPMRGA
ncbi:MAG TPA: DUF6335 family protein, partial [Vicinamibacteria bacterium]